MGRFGTLIASILLLASAVFLTDAISAEFKFAAGSCNKHYKDQSYWDFIAEKEPELFVWLGDNIYADHFDYEERRFAYLKQKLNPHYFYFAAKTPITGIWDDHDYAFNNAGAEYEGKDLSKLALLEFFNEPFETDVYTRPGIYRKISINKDNLKIDFVFLDTRSFMIDKGPDKTILGVEQFNWLEKTLNDLDGDLVFIASGVHVISDFSLNNLSLEGWGTFKNDRKRFFNLISKLNQPVVILSGDRHTSSLSRRQINNKIVYEIMASGLTHSYPGPLPNKYRIGKKVGKTNFGVISVNKAENSFFIDLSFNSTKNGRKLYSQRINL